MITQENIRHFFEYDPETGVLVRVAKVNRHNGLTYPCHVVVSGDNGAGYSRVEVCGQRAFAHVVIFILMVGRHPESVDHINGDKQDNRWANLREVSHGENMVNKGVYKNSPFGVPGVSFKHGSYVAAFQMNGERFHVGSFPTLDAARVALITARSGKGFHNNHGARPSWRG